MEVWKASIQLIKIVYRITKPFPKEEKQGLIAQIGRSSISISANISERNSSYPGKDHANFTTMAYSSLMETLNLMITSLELNYIGTNCYEKFRFELNKIAKKLTALRKSQLSK